MVIRICEDTFERLLLFCCSGDPFTDTYLSESTEGEYNSEEDSEEDEDYDGEEASTSYDGEDGEDSEWQIPGPLLSAISLHTIALSLRSLLGGSVILPLPFARKHGSRNHSRRLVLFVHCAEADKQFEGQNQVCRKSEGKPGRDPQESVRSLHTISRKN